MHLSDDMISVPFDCKEINRFVFLLIKGTHNANTKHKTNGLKVILV